MTEPVDHRDIGYGSICWTKATNEYGDGQTCGVCVGVGVTEAGRHYIDALLPNCADRPRTTIYLRKEGRNSPVQLGQVVVIRRMYVDELGSIDPLIDPTKTLTFARRCLLAAGTMTNDPARYTEIMDAYQTLHDVACIRQDYDEDEGA